MPTTDNSIDTPIYTAVELFEREQEGAAARPKANAARASRKGSERTSSKSDERASSQSDERATSKSDERGASKSEDQSLTSRAVDMARDRMLSSFQKPADQLDKFARALRFSGEQVEGAFAVPLTKTADGLENAARQLRTASAQDVMQSIATFAQRKPLVFLGAAMLLGIGSGRFLKSRSV